MAQIAFAGLPYPGVDIIPPNIKLNIYSGVFLCLRLAKHQISAPIWFAVITNIIAILITACLLKDTEEVEELKNGEKLMKKYL